MSELNNTNLEKLENAEMEVEKTPIEEVAGPPEEVAAPMEEEMTAEAAAPLPAPASEPEGADPLPDTAEEAALADDSLVEPEDSEEEAAADAPQPEQTDAANVIERDLKTTLSNTERRRQNAARRRERARRIRHEAPLDEFGNPIVDGNGTFDPILAEISRKRNTREIVSGIIEEVKPGRDGGEGWVELSYMGYRVLIPFSEMDIDVPHRSEESKEDYQDRLYRRIGAMLGANIEFVISGVDRDANLIAGSRAAAARQRRRNILDAIDRDGNYLIYPGRQVRGSVLAVFHNFALVDVYGMICRLRIRDIQADYVADVADELENGMSIPLYVTNVERDENGSVTLLYISMRNDRKEKEQLENRVNSLREGDECLGRVTARTRSAIFLKLNNGLQAFAYVSNGIHGRRIPNIGDRVAIRVLAIEKNRQNDNPIVRGRIIRSINYNAR